MVLSLTTLEISIGPELVQESSQPCLPSPPTSINLHLVSRSFQMTDTIHSADIFTCTRSLIVRVSRTRDGRRILQWCTEDELTLDVTHAFTSMYPVTEHGSILSVDADGDDILINSDLLKLLSIYSMWHKRDLTQICAIHHVHVLARDTAVTMFDKLTLHQCSTSCTHAIAIFTTLRAPRTSAQLARPRPIPRSTVSVSPTSYMTVVDDTLREFVINDWQRTVNTENLRFMSCAVCARRTLPHDIINVHPSDIDLTLITNDALPPRVRPTTYAFDLYDHALLHPGGMTDKWALATLHICVECKFALVDHSTLPKFSLANWLYYGMDELPQNVKHALTSSTFVDRMLVSRARSSRISFRFKQVPELDPADEDTPVDLSDRVRAVPQRYLRGNLLVIPQNSTRLHTVLPPSTSDIRDTVCAVFVGQQKPTTATIKKLRPLLARKSVVETIINFLTENNPYYLPDGETFLGLDRANLDALFGPSDAQSDIAIPCAMEIGFLEDNDAIRASTSDYVHREDDQVPTNDPDSLLMENVGYTCGDESPVSYQDMKMRALSHCLDHGRFICSRAGDTFVPDFANPALLTWLFPHLDPWGIGSFHHPERSHKISMEDQLKYLLMLDNGPFESDPDFAFVYYNILQKKRVCDSVRFRVKASQQRRIIASLLAIDKDLLQRMIRRCQHDPSYIPTTEEEKNILSLVDSVATVLPNIPGTTGYKLALRNQIRALVNFKGTPAFFLTINPSDIHHPLVRLYSGQQISLEDAAAGQDLTSWERTLLVANNPGACARFFHTIVSRFIAVILRYGKHENGLFGKCTAYYGTVEAQARGTLHLHMLIWIDGHPSPQEMRDAMSASPEYTAQVFSWLESLIKSELLGATDIVTEPDGHALPRPPFTESRTNIHPGVKPQPQIADLAPEQFKERYTTFVNELVQRYNWHQHTDTCWKYLRSNQTRSDENCRMRIDGITRPQTTLDPATLSIQLRRLHPRIANYNDLVIFLLQCNMDIKHIGSGEGAKALIYYITDYITKSSVPAHLGLAALMYAIKASTRHRPDHEHPPDRPSSDRSALTIVVNSLLSRMEISHPQVMSYLVGGGDHYTSHRYRILYYTSFLRIVQTYWHDRHPDPISQASQTPSTSRDQHGPPLPGAGHAAHNLPATATQTPHQLSLEETATSDNGTDEESVTLTLGHGSITAINQKQDYLLRPDTEPFNSMSLYQFVGLTEKVTSSNDNSRLRDPAIISDSSRPRGRPRADRGTFLPTHPDFTTHLVRHRVIWVIPVLLGPRIPRHDGNDEERELWSRIILTLFVPWRSPADLKHAAESWHSAYLRNYDQIPSQHRDIIRNMNVLNECRDARDKARENRRRLPRTFDIPEVVQPVDDSEQFDSSDPSAADLPDHQHPSINPDDTLPTLHKPSLLDIIDSLVSRRARVALDSCVSRSPVSTTSTIAGTVTRVTAEDSVLLQQEYNRMRRLKRKRRPDPPQQSHTIPDHATSTLASQPADLTSMTLPPNTDHSPSIPSQPGPADLQEAIDYVIHENKLNDNTEQLRAFQIVARHVCFGGPQLLMYVAGVGGTGKSYLINAIIKLFTILRRRDEILLSAPTGAAAVLIGGYTIHSLLLLPSQSDKPNLQMLTLIWDTVLYLIIDEISMVSAGLMSQISSRLQHAKGRSALAEDRPFGGINVIFLGDFGQLKPVRGAALYAHKYNRQPTAQDASNKAALAAMKGIYIWRNLVKTVVVLRKNQRQRDDHDYSALLDRIRRGQSANARHARQAYDFRTLQHRLLQNIDTSDATRFADSPIIVGRKPIRDALNYRLLQLHADKLHATVHVYYAVDTIDNEPLDTLNRDMVWDLPSSRTHDSLGRLPLFPGMRIMIQENIAFIHNVANGAIGTIQDIKYDERLGYRSVSVLYVHIPGAGKLIGQSHDDVIPVFPTPHPA